MQEGEKCNNPNCNNLVTEKRKKDGQYKKYCSLSCQRLSVANKIKETCLEKYGVTNPSKSQIVKDRIKESFTEKYGEGITNAMDLQEFKDKIKETNIERYGTDKPQLLEKFEQKSKETCLEKYGIEKPQKLQSLKDKSKKTCIEKYGVIAPQQNLIIRQKSIDTCLEKYNVSNVMQSKNIFDKNRYYKKRDFIFPSGKIIKIQGYEDRCIRLLLRDLQEDDIKINPDIDPLYYFEKDNSKHRYYPDIYIPKENLIIEVKSKYTYSGFIGWYNTNLLKRQACLDAGYNFKFMVFDKKGNLIEDK